MPLSHQLRAHVLALMAAATCVHATHAQPAQADRPSLRLPGSAEIEAARARLSRPEDIEAAMRSQSIPQLPPGALNPAAQSALDLSELAMRYDQLRGLTAPPAARNGEQQRTAQGLMIFASLGMPEPSLQRLIQDAERLQAPIILRGVIGGSMQGTMARIQQLMGQRRVTWQIDPALYRQFDVQAVPAYLLIDPDRPAQVGCETSATSQCAEVVFGKVTGDVTAEHALRLLAARPGALQAAARRELGRLAGRP